MDTAPSGPKFLRQREFTPEALPSIQPGMCVAIVFALDPSIIHSLKNS